MRYFRLTMVWAFVAFVLIVGPSLTAQTMAESTSTPVTNETSEWGNSFLWAFASSWIMRIWRKSPKLGGFTDATALRTQRFIGAAVAFLSGIGISFAFDAQTGQLVVSGLLATSLMNGVRQFFMQEFVYHAALKKSPVA